MRIIAGENGGCRLTSLNGLYTRPTADRVKEAIFSILGARIHDAHVLDLFAGSGALGLEALSRGAKSAVFVDLSGKAVPVIKENVGKMCREAQSTIVRKDYRQYLKGYYGQKFDVVFIDPPYQSAYYEDAIELIFTNGLLAGVIVCECDVSCKIDSMLHMVKEAVYGKTKVMIFGGPTRK